MTLQQTNMDVSNFEDNSAKTGGAISLEDLCVVSRHDITLISLLGMFNTMQIYLLRGSNMTFIRNSAETQGGAILALFPSDSNVLPIFNTRCFIHRKYRAGLLPVGSMFSINP